MTILVEKNSLFSIFNVDTFSKLREAIELISPSMVEYYINNLSSNIENIYLNKTNIQDSFSFLDYIFYFDYEENIYLQINNNYTEQTESLW